jgi:acetyl-CoA carboxylase biotin carboxyl carrier protein
LRKQAFRSSNSAPLKTSGKKEDITKMEVVAKAHMPGLVARVVVNEGDQVKAGQEGAVINCMKTELSVVAPSDGVVKSILVQEWDEMEVGSPMVVLEA